MLSHFLFIPFFMRYQRVWFEFLARVKVETIYIERLASWWMPYFHSALFGNIFSYFFCLPLFAFVIWCTKGSLTGEIAISAAYEGLPDEFFSLSTHLCSLQIWKILKEKLLEAVTNFVTQSPAMTNRAIAVKNYTYRALIFIIWRNTWRNTWGFTCRRIH